MSYDSQSALKFGNIPVELITFRTGPNSYLYCTTHERAITVAGTVYDPYPFDRDSRKISNAFEDDGLKIVVLPDHPICSHFRTFPTNYDVSILVRQGFLDASGNPTTGAIDTDYPVLVMGWIGSVELDPDNGQMTLAIVTIGDTLSAPSLARQFQHSCPLRLYGPKCKAQRKFLTITPSAMLSNRLSFVTPWQGTYQASDFIGGVISFFKTGQATEYRTIVRASSAEIVFMGSAQNLSGYGSIQVAVGCPHTLDGCLKLHDNSRRYGGFPYMPFDNPVKKSVAS